MRLREAGDALLRTHTGFCSSIAHPLKDSHSSELAYSDPTLLATCHGSRDWPTAGKGRGAAPTPGPATRHLPGQTRSQALTCQQRRPMEPSRIMFEPCHV